MYIYLLLPICCCFRSHMMEKKSYRYTELPPAYDDDVPILITDHKPQTRPRSQSKGGSGRLCCLLLNLLLSLACIAAGTYLIYHSYSFYRQPTDYPSTHQKVQYVIKFFYPVKPEDLQPQTADFVEFVMILGSDVTDKKCSMPDADRVDCFPGGGSTKQNCQAKGKFRQYQT